MYAPISFPLWTNWVSVYVVLKKILCVLHFLWKEKDFTAMAKIYKPNINETTFNQFMCSDASHKTHQDDVQVIFHPKSKRKKSLKYNIVLNIVI